MSSKQSKCAQMCLNKPKGAWMTLNKKSSDKPEQAKIAFKWTSIDLIELKQAQMSVNKSI